MKTVEDLYSELGALIGQGCGSAPVFIQLVEEGVTYAMDFEVTIADPADGNLVWLYPTAAVLPQELPK